MSLWTNKPSLHVCIATPARSGWFSGETRRSHLALQRLLLENKIECTFPDLKGEALLPLARNTLASSALHRNYYSHLCLWDDDVGMAPQHLLEMLRLDKPVVAVACPRKEIRWENVRAALRRNPATAADRLAGCSGTTTINFADASSKVVDFAQPLSVLEVGAGLMLIQMRVLQEMAASCLQDEWYYDRSAGARGQRIYDFFPLKLDKQARCYVNEDYAFCRRWRAMGGEVLVLPWIKATHTGNHVYTGNLLDTLECLMERVEDAGAAD